jgi:site-specific DNA recombinase
MLQKPQRAGVYTRISQDRDGKSEAPTRQLDDCTRLCKDRGLAVVDVYSDRDTSAYSGVARPEYKRMVADIQSGRIDTIVCWKLDRIHRRFTAFGDLLSVLDKHGGGLISVSEPGLDLSSPMGKAMLGVLVAIAESESESTSLRVRRSIEASIARGDVPKGGSRCFGYTVEGKIARSEANKVRWMADQYLSGVNFRQIAKALNLDDVPTVKNNVWTSKTVGQLLRSPRIGGFRLAPDKKSLVRGQWTPILKEDLFRDLQKALAAAHQPAVRSNEPSHLLTGLAVCGLCGCRLAVRTWKMPHANNRPFKRLACIKDVGRANCGKVSASEMRLDEIVKLECAEHVVALRHLDLVPASEIRKARRDLVKDRKSLGELTKARFVDRRIGEADYEPARVALELAIEQKELVIGSSNQAICGLAAMSLGDIEKWWETEPISAQRALARSVIEKVVLHPAKQRGGNVFDPSRIEIQWKAGVSRSNIGT